MILVMAKLEDIWEYYLRSVFGGKNTRNPSIKIPCLTSAVYCLLSVCFFFFFFFVCFFFRAFITLNLTSVLAMVVNMYQAISFDHKYFTWKTKKKALVCFCVIWLINLLMLFLFAIPFLDINFDYSHVN